MAAVVEEYLGDEAATLALGARLARGLSPGLMVFLKGELGAGKTTLVRGLLRALGYEGAVRSPTFTLLEPYTAADWRIYHFDLYRLSDPEELEYIGAREYFGDDALCLVEWPERGAGWLPPADILIELECERTGRRARISAQSSRGEAALARL
ncbi:MAG: tRNA threonylcarbamoyladenosine biosynthesis protein TsaE [Gammaproteobacteria bacterium SG8_47]|nr:MAG: tRNA threonylcarbamoyladenosine biosynthesis protein TsaE [Gammaproteobacteria bacterium SG8_47]